MHTHIADTLRLHYNSDWSGEVILHDEATGAESKHNAASFLKLARSIVAQEDDEAEHEEIQDGSSVGE
jgi:hypothetical protein